MGAIVQISDLISNFRLPGLKTIIAWTAWCVLALLYPELPMPEDMLPDPPADAELPPIWLTTLVQWFGGTGLLDKLPARKTK